MPHQLCKVMKNRKLLEGSGFSSAGKTAKAEISARRSAACCGRPKMLRWRSRRSMTRTGRPLIQSYFTIPAATSTEQGVKVMFSSSLGFHDLLSDDVMHQVFSDQPRFVKFDFQLSIQMPHTLVCGSRLTVFWGGLTTPRS